MQENENLDEYDHLIRAFESAYKNQDLNQLNVLIEYVRGQGIFYADYHEKQAALLNLY